MITTVRALQNYLAWCNPDVPVVVYVDVGGNCREPRDFAIIATANHPIASTVEASSVHLIVSDTFTNY